jgi:hypothetical protein
MKHGVALALAVSALGCGGALAHGERQFDQGRYSDAERTFAAIELASCRWDRRQRAEYALYRGLTYDALGDVPRALAWLREAQAGEAASPGTLRPDDVRRLGVAIDGLGPGDGSAAGPAPWP